MYRNSQDKGFKPLIKCEQQSTSSKTKESSNSDRATFEILNQSSHRSTASILNLFKKPVEKHDQKISQENVPIKSNKESAVEIQANLPNVTDNNKTIYNVVMAKKSTRKHKIWENDGTLEITGKRGILKDSEGNIIHRTTVKPENIVEGFRLYIENKEIEIVDKITHTDSQLLSKKLVTETIPSEPPMKKIKTIQCSPYVPLASLKKGLHLTYEPLIMPSIYTLTNWSENDTPDREEEVSIDACLANALRPHQRNGVVFLYECIMGLKLANYFGAILADEMGLGKTLQCITIIWTLLKKGPYRKPVLKYVLIVTPSSLCNNWNKEFSHWLGFHRIFPYIVNAKNKPKDFRKQSRNSVMIISYDMLIRCQTEIEQISFDLIVCDEGHRLKNSDIKAAKILNNINCKKRILLSGTPIQNDLQEFFALIDFVNPGILGNHYEFKQYYGNPIVASQCSHATNDILSLGTERANELHEKTKFFILRRTQDTINKYLPSKHELVVFCRLSDEQKDLYMRVTDAWFDKTGLSVSTIPHLTIITMLKKICNHPDLFYSEKNDLVLNDLKNGKRNDYKKGCDNVLKKAYSGKISIVQSLMRNLKETKEKLVLVSYYTQTLDLLESICNNENLHFLRLDGSTASNSRSKIIQQFNSETHESKVFLLSAKAGGVGLNLPGASRLVLFDSDWNPASDAQAMARVWREGQKKNVYILRLLTTGTIEEKIFQRQISKASLSETIVDLNNFASLKLSMSELKDLFTLASNTNCLTHDLIKCPCDGYKEIEKRSEECCNENPREHQLFLEDKVAQQNLAINQLLEWEHYQQPIPDKILQELMLSEVSNNITFLFRNSTLNEIF